MRIWLSGVPAPEQACIASSDQAEVATTARLEMGTVHAGATPAQTDLTSLVAEPLECLRRPQNRWKEGKTRLSPLVAAARVLEGAEEKLTRAAAKTVATLEVMVVRMAGPTVGCDGGPASWL